MRLNNFLRQKDGEIPCTRAARRCLFARLSQYLVQCITPAGLAEFPELTDHAVCRHWCHGAIFRSLAAIGPPHPRASV